MNYLPNNHRQFVSVIDFASATVLSTVTVETISTELEWSVSQANSRKVVVDFTTMLYLTSEMIGGLMMFRRYCVRNEIELKLCNLSENVKSVFALTTLDTLFDCYDGSEEAVKAFHDEAMNCNAEGMSADYQEA